MAAPVVLPFEPLEQLVIARFGKVHLAGDPLARHFYSFRLAGGLTAAQADRWACALEHHPAELWGDAWWALADPDYDEPEQLRLV